MILSAIALVALIVFITGFVAGVLIEHALITTTLTAATDEDCTLPCCHPDQPEHGA